MARINSWPWVCGFCVLSLVALSPVTADQHEDSSHLLEKIYTRLQAAEKKISLQDEKIDHQSILIKKLQIEVNQMRERYSEGHKESHSDRTFHNRSKRQLNLQSSILSYVKNATKTVGSSGSVYTRWGRTSCEGGASLLYSGYLMTGEDAHIHSYQYECVDETPEFVIGQQASTSGALLYFVKPDCDGDGTTGHCPPYEEGKQLTCVMCSK